MESSLKSRTTVGIIWSFIDLIFNQGINLIIQVILARLLMPEDFGIIGIVIAFLALANTFVDSGFTNALIRETETTQEDYSTVFYYNLFASVSLYILIFFTSPLIASFYVEPRLLEILRILSLTIIISSVGSIQMTMLIKKLDFRSQTITNSLSSLIAGIISVSFAYSGLGIWSLVMYNLLKNIIQTLLYVIFNRWCPSFYFSYSSFKKYFNFGWKILLSSIIDNIYANINSLIIGKIYSKNDLGYYTNANKISSVAQSSIYGVVGKVSYPVLGKIQNNSYLLKRGYQKTIKFTSFVNFPLMIGLIVVAEPLILTLMGAKWEKSIIIFQLLCISGILYPLQALNLSILQVKGRSDLFLKVSLIKKLISTLLLLVVIFFKLGIVMLLTVGVVDSFISYYINSYYSSKLLDYSMKNQISDIAPLFFVSLVMGAIILVFQRYFILSNLYQLILSVSIGSLSYFSISHFLKIGPLIESIDMLRNLFRNN